MFYEMIFQQKDQKKLMSIKQQTLATSFNIVLNNELSLQSEKYSSP